MKAPKMKRLRKEKAEKLCSSVLLVGPSGSGKTACVYAVAKEKGFEIIEVILNIILFFCLSIVGERIVEANRQTID